MKCGTTYQTILAEYEKYLEDASLALQLCKDCGSRQWFPRTLCKVCLSRELEWEVSKGLGRIHSYSILHRSPVPDKELPYAVALIDLDEGVRTMATLEDPTDARLDCDVRVELKGMEPYQGRDLAVFGVVEE